MKKIIFGLSLLLINCQKENSTTNTSNDFIGEYCGEFTEDGSWGIFNTIISKSETDKNKIIFSDFLGEDSVEAIVNGYNLKIPEKTFRKVSHSGLGNLYYYDWTISGYGQLDPNKHFIYIDLTEKRTLETGGERVSQGIVKIFNSSKYSYIGTFKGDSATIIISTFNNSLLVSVCFQKGWIPYGWNFIKATESQCSISLSADSINEISTNDIYRLSGSAQKYGDSLFISLFAYCQGISPLYIYEFRVGKIH